MARIKFHKLRILLNLLGISSIIAAFYILLYDRTNARERIILHPSHSVCVHPQLEVNTDDVQHFVSTKDILVCDDEVDWVEVQGFEAVILQSAKDLHGDIKCTFTELLRVDDGSTRKGSNTTTRHNFIFVSSDFYNVFCSAADGNVWENTLIGIRNDQNLLLERGWHLLPNHAVKLNILMIGFDSLSHSNFIRALPNTYRYLTKEMGSNVLAGYNIVGDGTSHALIPILTGKTELELPEARKRMAKQAHYVDIFPFIWQNFKDNGYITLYAEDQPMTGTFNYRLKGFHNQPADHYMRTYFNYMYPQYKEHPKYCFRSTPRHKVFLDYITNFYDVYKEKPKFAFAFYSELSNDDYSLISVADEDILGTLQNLKKKGHFDNTILMLFSDQGHRFAARRSTQQGKQEERLPFFSIFLPASFKEMYPSAADNVKVNSKRLTTPFDIYPTLKDLTEFSGAKLGKVSERGISLFSEIPPSRTCLDAFIEPHWCACLTWDPLPTTDDKVIEASKALVHYINTYTAPQRGFCHEMKLHNIVWAALLLPNEGLVKFKKSADFDGFLPDMSDQMVITEEVYQISISTIPVNDFFKTSSALPTFEASLTYNVKQDTFSVKINDVSRINKYGDQPHCILENLPELRKFCYCLKPPTYLQTKYYSHENTS